MRVAAVISDLMLYSRIESAASAASASLVRVDSPAALPEGDLDLLLIDWAARGRDWTSQLVDWSSRAPDARLILFGMHTDMDAHSEARAAGLGPMWARSRLIRELPSLLGIPAAAHRQGSPAPAVRRGPL